MTTAVKKKAKAKRKRVEEKTRLPAAAKRRGTAMAKSPWPETNAEHNKKAPEHKKPTPKRRAKNAKNAGKAHSKRTDWL